MTAALISVNVHLAAETDLQVHRTANGRVWLEIGRPDGSVGLFVDPDGLVRLGEAVRQASELRAA
ncbi:hypothetical protein ACFFX1_34975 [Dactylosporangium sucinum]|uniref:Uncharacterized protein n=1 Tax=Dactylosporangium sucinum TaxID=1424081 RepID=A0A917U1F6_9ACTN|nr:hypothetical protein [Dactylosporangium sucinum]GGM50445.1 hypothetical protein GCM10007977_060210 [Dactylosporangium sucinum]